MKRRSSQKIACCVVLAAMACSLGASRCGCWEHSGWRAALAVLAGEDRGRPLDEDHVEPFDCEGLAVQPATNQARQIEASAGGGFTIPAVLERVDPAELASSQSNRQRPEAPLPTLPVRALLCVLRL